MIYDMQINHNPLTWVLPFVRVSSTIYSLSWVTDRQLLLPPGIVVCLQYSGKEWKGKYE